MSGSGKSKHSVVAPMTGPVSFQVEDGTRVSTGDLIAVQTSGKTVANIIAPEDGILCIVAKGDKPCNVNDVIAVVETA